MPCLVDVAVETHIMVVKRQWPLMAYNKTVVGITMAIVDLN